MDTKVSKLAVQKFNVKNTLHGCHINSLYALSSTMKYFHKIETNLGKRK